jgi:DNA repair protein RadA/Sms
MGRASFACAECGWRSPKWVGRCGECQAWGSVAEVGAGPASARARTAALPVSNPARPIVDVDVESAHAQPTGVAELDRVLGGGLVPGAVVLLAGEPGIGKSTLFLDVAAKVAGHGSRVLYVSGEESAAQVRLRAGRVDALSPQLYLAAETDLSAVLGHVDAVDPALLVVDSVQTIASGEVDGAAGNVSQVREVAACLVGLAKERGITVLLVGHVTKDGSIAGPRVLEHVVDVVLQFDGERHSRLRMVRAAKNRFGPTDEIGCFDLGEDGIFGVLDPSGLFLSTRVDSVAGTCVTVTLEGRRPLTTEVQALVASTQLTNPRRATSGVDGSRVAMILAVLGRRARIAIHDQDVYVSTVGGVRIGEPASDLAVALAVASSRADFVVPSGVVAIGEVGLSGEIRPVGGLTRRLSEAARLGFTTAIVPPDPGTVPEGMRVVAVDDVGDAVRALVEGAGTRRRHLTAIPGGVRSLV